MDYGLKRTGIAVTDPLQIICTPLETVSTQQVFDFLSDYLSRESVDKLVVGWPTDLYQRDTDATVHVSKFIKTLETKFPGLEVIKWDERFTSKIARQAISGSGLGKKKRRDKKLVDKISASLILQSYLGI